MRVVICVPTGEMMFTGFFKSFFGLYERLKNDADIDPIIEETSMKPLETARNGLVYRALEHEPDYLLWLDSDQHFSYDLFHKLLRHDKDIVSGLYFQKVMPYKPNALLKKKGGYTHIPTWDGSLTEVDAVGMGAVLIKAKVFKDIEAPWFKFHFNDIGQINVSEDVYFCEKAKEKGYRVHVDTSAIVRHIGGDGIGAENYKIHNK